MITILDGFWCSKKILTELEKIDEVSFYKSSNSNEVFERIKSSEIVLTNKVQISNDLLDKLPVLKYVGICATGTNAVDVGAFIKKGILLTNVPSYSTYSVAQHIFALLLEITNKVGFFSTWCRCGNWQTYPYYCYFENNNLIELKDKTIGIYGYGSIGKAVKQIALGFGLKPLVYSPHSKTNESVDKDELFKNSDIVVLTCPLNEDTKNLICKKNIDKMKNGVIIINTSRGGCVNEDDLYNALLSGKVMAAASDVTKVEPQDVGNKLANLDNMFFTPHIAWTTNEALERFERIVVDNIKCYKNGKPQNVVG